MTRGHSEYRPDIDGLRTIAVVPVVLFHAGFPWISGGYIGVDVFFVISGFLITSIIISEVDSGHFSIASFYDRRIRRIVPALSSVIAFCIAIGFWLLTPKDFEGLGRSVVATIFFVSNIYFWRNTNYFDQNASEQPLLHTWSLSIEEQFYLGYPLLLLVLSRVKRARFTILCLLCMTSFLLSALLVYVKPSATFYLGPTRAWELFFGGLISIVGPKFYLRTSLRAAAAVLGVLLILIPVFTYTPLTRFPGLAALPPVLGSGLLIWTGQKVPTVVHVLLSKMPLTMIGKASYSLYLWHLPLIVFAVYATGGPLSTRSATVVCLMALAISFVSLRLIEWPFRFPPRASIRAYCSAAIAAGILLGGTGFLIVVTDGLPGRMDQSSRTYLEAENDKNRNHTDCLSLEDHIVRPDKACLLGTPDVEPTVLLWGDSHAMVTALALEQAARKAGASFLFAASVDCPIGLGFSIDPTIGPTFVATPGYQYCGQYNEEMLKLALTHPNIKAVVLSSRWTNWRLGEAGAPSEGTVDIRLRSSDGIAKTPFENREIFAAGFERLIKSLSPAKAVWIVGPIPQPASRVPKALYIHHLGFDGQRVLDVPRSEFDAKNRWIMDFLTKISRQYPVRMILPESMLCSGDNCPISEGGKPLFFDDNHLSMLGVSKTAPLYDQVFQSIAIKK